MANDSSAKTSTEAAPQEQGEDNAVVTAITAIVRACKCSCGLDEAAESIRDVLKEMDAQYDNIRITGAFRSTAAVIVKSWRERIATALLALSALTDDPSSTPHEKKA